MNSNTPVHNRFDLKPLRQFFFSYGHLHVPDSPGYEALFDLCNKLRASRSILPELTVSELDSMKFNWGMKTARPPWHDRYNELKKFKQRTGRFPRRNETKHASLSNWTFHQRMLKKKGKLSSERIKLLNSIHFNWEKKTLGEAWNNNYRSFIDYKKKLVPEK